MKDSGGRISTQPSGSWSVSTYTKHNVLGIHECRSCLCRSTLESIKGASDRFQLTYFALILVDALNIDAFAL
jgi:hypothetical protein